MNVTESITWTSADSGAKTLKGGRYLFNATATFGGGSVALQAMLADGSTFATITDAGGNAVSLTAAGWKTVDLTPGQYKLAIVTATAVFANATSVPV